MECSNTCLYRGRDVIVTMHVTVILVMKTVLKIQVRFHAPEVEFRVEMNINLGFVRSKVIS